MLRLEALDFEIIIHMYTYACKTRVKYCDKMKRFTPSQCFFKKAKTGKLSKMESYGVYTLHFP